MAQEGEWVPVGNQLVNYDLDHGTAISPLENQLPLIKTGQWMDEYIDENDQSFDAMTKKIGPKQTSSTQGSATRRKSMRATEKTVWV